MTNKQKLMKRVNTLLENKSNKFKRKYFLLSALASTNIKNNSQLFSEAKCYANVLVETNGEKPSEEFLIKLNKDALEYDESQFNAIGVLNSLRIQILQSFQKKNKHSLLRYFFFPSFFKKKNFFIMEFIYMEV